MNAFSEIGGKEYDLRKDNDFEQIQGAIGIQAKEKFREAKLLLEVGIGSGETTKQIFGNCGKVKVIGLDPSKEMIETAKQKLAPFVSENRIEFVIGEALEYLEECKANSFDGVFSGLTFHNFIQEYRQKTLEHVFRVLKKGGWFLNLDLFAFDDPPEHQVALDKVRKRYLDAYAAKNRPDLAEWWMKHIDGDNTPERIMLTNKTIKQMEEIGFSEIKETFRDLNRAVIIARK